MNWKRLWRLEEAGEPDSCRRRLYRVAPKFLGTVGGFTNLPYFSFLKPRGGRSGANNFSLDSVWDGGILECAEVCRD